MGARRRLSFTVAALGAAALAAGCGEDDFENLPRPPSPIELAAVITDDEVKVSPSTAKAVGAGTATVTISNQSQDPGALVLEGPSDEASDEIAPGGVASIKVELLEGDYTVSAGEDSDARESKLVVGPERPSSQNEVLLP